MHLGLTLVFVFAKVVNLELAEFPKKKRFLSTLNKFILFKL